MTRKDIRDFIFVTLGSDWMARNSFTKNYVNDMIWDEIDELIADTHLLEGEYTGTTDGTNNYMEINENIFMVRRVHYDYTDGSDLGDLLEEITPLEIDGTLESGVPTYYWLQGMHRYDRQRLYFDTLPESGITVRALFYKFHNDITDDTTTLELKRLWGKAIKHIIIAQLSLAGKPQRNGLGTLHMGMFEKAMKTIKNVPKAALSGTTMVYRDIG